MERGIERAMKPTKWQSVSLEQNPVSGAMIEGSGGEKRKIARASVPTYEITSSLLSSFSKRWVKKQQSSDVLCIVGGVIEDGVVRLREKSPMSISLRGFQERDEKALELLNRVLEDMKTAGCNHVAHLHVKPVEGKYATTAESRHHGFQRYLVLRGLSAVGVILSSDGFVKPFSGGNTPFQFAVTGDRVQDVSERDGEPIWKIK